MSSNIHLLVVDDDQDIRELLQEYLQHNGYRVSVAEDGKGMWRVLDKEHIDLVVLDIMLPGDDGLTLCRQLRASSALPVIMLTALGDETDRIVGLELGADDYLAKPFNPRELLARVRGVLRRAGGDVGEMQTLRFADWTIDRNAHHLVSPQGVVVNLSSGEYRLLDAFLSHPNRVLSRDQLMEILQGRDWGPFDRSIDVQVSRLRRRLKGDGKGPDMIKTVRGEGYMFTAKVSRVKL